MIRIKYWLVAMVLAAALVVGYVGSVAPVRAAAPAQAEATTIVKTYYDAYNAGDIDGALAFIADNAIFINPTGTYKGKTEIRTNLEATKKDGLSFELSDLKDDNGRVVYAYKVIIGGQAVETGTDGLTIVKDGKIIFDGTVGSEAQLPTTGMDPTVHMLLWVATFGVVILVVGGVLLLRSKKLAHN